MTSIILGLFCFIIIPFWLALHYFTQWSSSRKLSKEEMVLLENLWRNAERMEERVNVLETILEHDKGVK